MKFSTLISFLLLSVFTYAQFEQTVIGSQGGQETVSGYTISYTVGEAVVVTLPSNTLGGNYLTQGFQQPKTLLDANQIDTIVYIAGASCFGVADGMLVLDSIIGCDTDYDVTLTAGADDAEIEISTHDTVYNLSSGTYILSIEADNELCSGTFLIEIGVADEDCELHFYNAFSPNEDGVNDTWTISHVASFPENSIQIFDRWGVLTWKIDGYNNQDKVWAGRNLKGHSVPDGTYYYLFTTEPGAMLRKGYVEITR